MTDSQTPTYRSHTTPTGDHIEYRQPEEDADVFEVRMPIATTGEVRNQGDDPLTRDELDGMARQINDGSLGVFLDHGGSNLGGPKPYSAIGKIGEWTDATLDNEREDGEDALMATARIMDPESLPAGVNDLRAAVGAIKEQVKRDFSISSSIGWREDEAYPGGNDLMEASIVGIGADPRTTSQATDDAGLVARAAVEAGADPEELVATVQAAVSGDEDTDTNQAMTDDDTPEDGGTTDEQQSEEGDSRAPDDVTANDLYTFMAMHLDGMDESDLSEAVDAADASYVGELDTEALADLVSTATGAEYEAVMDAMGDLMESGMDEDEQEGDKPDDYDEDEEEEQSADTDAEESETEEQQSVDEELLERMAELEAELEDVRSGDLDVESPGGDDADAEEERTADDEPSNTTDDWRKHAHN